MITLGPVEQARDLAPARWAAPPVVLAGTAMSALPADACGGSLALPASGLALAVAGTVLWFAGIGGERRERIALAIGVALAALALAAFQQLMVCVLGRAGMVTAEMLQTGGLVLLGVALLAEALRIKRARSAARSQAGAAATVASRARRASF